MSRGRKLSQSHQNHQHRIPGQLKLIMTIGPLLNVVGVSARQDALDPRVHAVLAGPARRRGRGSDCVKAGSLGRRGP